METTLYCFYYKKAVNKTEKIITGNRHNYPPGRKKIRGNLYEIIFEADRPMGKLFDVALIIAILLSVLAVMLESVDTIAAAHGELLRGAEWVFTILFTIEYILRLYSAKDAVEYVKSPFGIIDFLSTVPSYLTLLIPGAQAFAIIRILRFLRVFRILKLVQYMSEAQTLSLAFRASRRKITVFLATVVCLCIILGSVMYIIEGEAAGFTSIPMSVYWAIVTMTTVGYGDISPLTPLGRAVASVIMITGYCIIAVPTGIVTSEMARVKNEEDNRYACDECGEQDHRSESQYCHKCGNWLGWR